MRLTLASTSPRRAAILTEHGFRFEVCAPTFDEASFIAFGLVPEEIARQISIHKANSVPIPPSPDSVILAADTIVALAGEVFGKPADRDDARRILTALSGTEHQVITGVTVRLADGRHQTTSHDLTYVRMRRMSDRELDTYLDSGEWQGKAGAYGIQDQLDPFVECTRGSFTNVIGLPIELTTRMLADYGVTPNPQLLDRPPRT